MAKDIATGLFLAICVSLPLQAQETVTVDWLAFAQFTAERFDGPSDDLAFGTERLRPRLHVSGGPWSGALQLDLAAANSSTRRPGTLANLVLDIHGDYRFGESHRVRFGQFKTPLGMDFNVSGRSLDITKRGMEAGLTLNRDTGFMLTGNRILGGLSYDVGVFNPPGRSQATDYLDAQVGQDSAAVARLRFDEGPWHIEAARGRATNAGGPASATYTVTDIGLSYSQDRAVFKAEWIDGDKVMGDPTRSERVYYVHGGYRIRPDIELVARHYAGKSGLMGSSTDLSNTYLGATFSLADFGRMRSRLQVNYVLAGGDELAYTGVRGFRDDALFVQLQLYAQK